MARQIPLELPVATSLARDDFVVSASNADAMRLLQEQTQRAMLLLGPSGTGKTHLAHIWAGQQGAQALPANLDAQAITTTSAWVWEDADKTDWSAETQQKAFHILNRVREEQARLLITATLPPREWPLQLADLRSRLLALPVATLQPPDDELLHALLLKHFSDRQLRAGEEVFSYLLPRLPRDGSFIMRFIEKLDRAALADQRAITVPLARQILEQTEN